VCSAPPPPRRMRCQPPPPQARRASNQASAPAAGTPRVAITGMPATVPGFALRQRENRPGNRSPSPVRLAGPSAATVLAPAPAASPTAPAAACQGIR
jgi:hypothetical protein